MGDKSLMAKARHTCPPHYFIIDCHNIGRCKNKNCSETRDYNKLQGRESGLSGLKPVRGGKRGKRKKEKYP